MGSISPEELRIQQERFFNEEDHLRLKGCSSLNEALLQLAQPDMPVLHPVIRKNVLE